MRGEYRPNAAIALFSRQGKVFLGRRLTGARHAWQMPQGGIDPGETPLQAALRELEEEIGVEASLVALLEEMPEWLSYDFPNEIRRRQGWRGQRQKWFAFRFLGDDRDVDLDRHKPEFGAWRWGELAEAPALVIPFKRPIYEEVARQFAPWAKLP